MAEVTNLDVYKRTSALADATDHADYLSKRALEILGDLKTRMLLKEDDPTTIKEVALDLLVCLSNIRSLVVRLRLDPGMIDEHQEGLKAIQNEVEQEIEYVSSLLR